MTLVFFEEENVDDRSVPQPEGAPKRINSFSTILTAILTPEHAFSDPEIFSTRRIVVFGYILIAATVGMLLTTMFHQNDVMRELSIRVSDRQVERFMTGADEDELADAKAAASGRISGKRNIAAALLSSGFSAAVSTFLYVIEVWIILVLASPFFGAAEDPLDGKAHRRSSYLAYYVAVPYGLNVLVTGIIFLFKDPASIGNVLTLADYNRVTNVSFNLVSLFKMPDIHPMFRYLLDSLTNPFYLWGLVILFFGGKAVLRIKDSSRMIALVIVLVVVLALQNWLFDAIGRAVSNSPAAGFRSEVEL